MADSSKDEPRQKQKSLEIKLKMNEDGYPILPSPEEIDGHDLLYKKRLVGRFMSDVYG